MNNILCGSSCVKYILNDFCINTEQLNLKMTWITELAIALKNSGIKNISILCYESNLYYDYKNNPNIDLRFNGFHYIEECIKNNIPINETKLSKIELLKEVKENKFIVLCVESSVFNNINMNGGHFIILNGIDNNKIRIINPIKNKYEYKLENVENIIKYCENYGSWRILIKEDNND